MPFLRADGNDVLLAIKAVPGATRTRIAGPLGDRLKITVSAAPEKGKANAAICQLLADLCSLPPRQVSIARSHSAPLKTVRLQGVSVEQIRNALDL